MPTVQHRTQRDGRTDMSRTRRLLTLLSVALTGCTMLATLFVSDAGASTTTIILGESNNAHVLVVHPGQHMTLVLHSTYWSIAVLVSSATISQVGSPVTASRLPSAKGGCVAGQGCGTVSAHYIAKSPGTIHLHASRTSCGEALRCTPDLSHWTVTIHVR